MTPDEHDAEAERLRRKAAGYGRAYANPHAGSPAARMQWRRQAEAFQQEATAHAQLAEAMRLASRIAADDPDYRMRNGKAWAQCSLAPALREDSIDAAARAIFEVRDDEFDIRVWDDLDSQQKERYQCDARAALEAAQTLNHDPSTVQWEVCDEGGA